MKNGFDEIVKPVDLLGGAYWFRTSDLLNVSQALSR